MEAISYIPTWNNKNGDFSKISPFFLGAKKKVLLMSCTLTQNNLPLPT